MTRRPTVAVICAPGTNRHTDMAFAFRLAGAEPDLVDVDDLPDQQQRFRSAQIVAVAGGFSYADALGSGRVFAAQLMERVGDMLREKIAAGSPVIGVCNGFQVLTRAGLLPGDDVGPAALAHNANGRFECRWVQLAAASDRCVWTRDLAPLITMPIAHGEGRFVVEQETLERLRATGRVALRYVRADGSAADGTYPHNPNGSCDDIAGVCDATGLVLGMMPHPENHVTARQGRSGSIVGEAGLALSLFRNGVNHVA
jgi:phosphoribosylformylglycinamidine synthase subunit PurQ / glutaminase